MFVHATKGALAKPTVNIVTSVGKSWMMWDATKMTLVFVGKECKEEIQALAVTGSEVYAVAGSKIFSYVRGKEAGVYKAPNGARLGKILLFGDQLLALKEDGSGLIIFELHQYKVQNEIQFHSSFTATTLLHPATYLNKVLIGSKEGELQLWNTRTCSLIHSFPHPSPSSASSVTALCQSPAIDVIGVGYLDGVVRVFDIRQGELVMQVKMDEGTITAVSFRMDGPPILATASSAGSIAVWDLSKGGRIIHVQRGAHEQSISGLEWVQGQPLLISSSGDNSVKQWLFDAPTAVPRLLKFRGGHHAPPQLIRYYGEDGKQILTAGRDRSLRYTSVVRDSRSHELSQGQSIIKRALGMGMSADELKLAPITAMSSSSTRAKDWEDVLTAHADEQGARTWRVLDSRIGAWVLEMEQGAVQAVCVTACGNFGLAGSSAGEIRMWNMQSGRERRSFALTGSPPGDTKSKIIATSKTGKAKEKAKAPVRSMQAITGLVTDALNTTVIASTLEGKLYFFDFHSTKLLHEMQLPSSITKLDLQRDNGLLAAACDDLVIRLVDIETRRVVRELRGFKGRVLDSAFSPDSRWLLATSLDSIIRTYDIPTGRLVDAFRTSSIATSLTFSPTGDFLATAHVDSLGVHLWANKAQFTEVPFRHINEDEEIVEIGLPTIQGMQDGEEIEGLENVGAPEYTDIYTTPEQLSEGLMTLSLLPRSRWQTLLNLETIKQRNKPKEPPKAPEKAPFFLPTISGLETRFDLSAAQPEEDDASRRLAPLQMLESDFTRRLAAEASDSDYNAFFEYAKALSPAALDLEIRSLVSLDHLSLFIHALSSRLASHRDFEAVQALMNVFLSVHADVLIANEELKNGLRNLQEEQKRETARLRELVGYAMGTLGFLRSTG
ncbi:WD-repeat protein [Papiliotrema laurentii]|uniref:WD-repeat protein n=1 Tax=Papiliotrema laurentii TaxID=5418 RepID=A0AAD9L7H4_PAPLA|nr:WD-repeat protein [Papiliotrema laurentii]